MEFQRICGAFVVRLVVHRDLGIFLDRRVNSSYNDEKLQGVFFISTGVYGYPVKEAAPIALNTIWDFLENHPGITLVRMVLFGKPDFKVYKKALTEIAKQRELSV